MDEWKRWSDKGERKKNREAEKERPEAENAQREREAETAGRTEAEEALQ